MMKTKEFNELISTIGLYCFGWKEWCNDEDCPLSPQEIYTVNSLVETIAAGSSCHAIFSHTSDQLLFSLLIKLKAAYESFKEWLVYKFLCQLLKLVKQERSENSLAKPIEMLGLSPEIKSVLKKFRIKRIRELGELYSADQLKTGALYGFVIEFYICASNSNRL